MDFKLRPWRTEDIDDLMHVANNANIAKNLTNRFPHPYTRESGEGFIKMATHEPMACIFCIEVNGKASGGIGLHFQGDIFCKNAELGYWLAEPYWGQGIITKAIEQIVAHGFQHYDINRIFARPFGSNIASQRALEKAGFALEARFEKTLFKNDMFEDEIVYAIRKM
jgi:[ribosomal protein S5]-alanine N-acetyltransferase